MQFFEFKPANPCPPKHEALVTRNLTKDSGKWSKTDCIDFANADDGLMRAARVTKPVP